MPLSEADFQRLVTDLAELLGWEWAHFRPAETARGWRTPVSGPLGKGFPDLVLVHPGRRRLMFVELKRDGAKLTPDQERVFEAMRMSAEYAIWHPAYFEHIARALSR